jgi:hypothetical protein
MAKLSVQQIKKRAREIVAEHPGGIKYSELLKLISTESPETPQNTITGSVWNLQQIYPTEIEKPSRGLFKAAGAGAGEAVVVGATEQTTPSGKKVHESDFYEPFAQWLKDELDEVTEVASLGGASMKSKWGTPDVVGVYKPLAAQLIKFSPEIVSAEIKTDPQAPVVAFGQAIAYRLFSSKTYVAMPGSVTEEDQGRLESLCLLFGVGLVLFDLDKSDPGFSIRVRAQRFSPDMFYVNEFAERLKAFDATLFQQLFG